MKKIKLSLYDMIARLGQTAPKTTLSEPSPNDKTEGPVSRTIRFSPDVNHWVVTQSEHLGVSVTDFVSLAIKGIMVTTQSPYTSELDAMAARFFMLFKEHGIATMDIPKYLPAGTLTRSELQETSKVLDALDNRLIEYLSKHFRVKEEWLMGISPRAYDTNRYHKNLQNIFSTITRHKVKYDQVKVWFLFEDGIGLEQLTEIRNGTYPHRNRGDVTAVLEVETEDTDILPHKYYQLWEELPWDHRPARLGLKSLLLFCERAHISYSTCQINSTKLAQLDKGSELMPALLDPRQRYFCWDELLWNDDRNPDLEELPLVKSSFKDYQGDLFVKAIRHPKAIIANLDEFVSGRAIEFKDKGDD